MGGDNNNSLEHDIFFEGGSVDSDIQFEGGSEEDN